MKETDAERQDGAGMEADKLEGGSGKLASFSACHLLILLQLSSPLFACGLRPHFLTLTTFFTLLFEQLSFLSPLFPLITALPLDSTYPEFNRISYLSMSSAKLVVSEDAKPFLIDSLQMLHWNSHTPSLEVEGDNKKSRETMEAKGEDRSPAPPPPSSSSSCSSEEIGIKEEKDRGKDAGDVGEDEGYHTPTSPRNRIPEVGRCPPAPRKPPPPLLYAKRKVRTGQAGQLVDVEGEIGSFWSAELADAVPRTKKPRREVANA